MKNPITAASLAHFKDGVRFECQGSGKCCVSHGEFGFVYLSLKDRARLAKHLHLDIEQFTKKHCRKIDGHWAIKDNPNDPNCVFLKDKKCGVYEGRPTQCRTWPFWPDVMSARSWKKNVVDFCPGIGKGKLYSEKEIMKIASDENDNVRQILVASAFDVEVGLKNK